MHKHSKLSLPGKIAALFAFSGLAATQIQAAPTKIQSVTPSGLKAAIAKNKGKVVMVNFWATWCGPCVEELPALAKLAKANSKKGVVLLLVSGDDASAKAQASKVLSKTGHKSSLLIQGDLVEFFEKFDPKMKGAIALPRTYFYNRQGKLVKSVGDAHSQAQYQKMLAPLM